MITKTAVVFMCVYLAIDLVYVALSRGYYEAVTRRIQGRGFASLTGSRLFGAILAYACLAAGWLLFVPLLISQLQKSFRPVIAGALAGLAYGLVVYGVFNGTLHVMFNAYDMGVFARDLLWGSSWACILSAAYAYFAVVAKK
jgi:uncharacterized membrane protein